MRNLIVGTVVGLVVGIVVGTTLVAPRFKLPVQIQTKFDVKPSIKPHLQKHGMTHQSRGAPRPTEQHVHVTKTKDSDKLTPVPKPRNTVQWRMASVYGSSLPHMGRLAKRLEDEIWKTSDGGLSIKFFEPETLVSTNAAFDAVRSGAIEAVFAAPSLWAEHTPALYLYSAIPFGPPIHEYLAWLHADGGAIMRDVYRKIGVHGIACGLLAPEGSGWFREPITSLEKLKSLRFGMTGLGGKVLQRLGTTVVPISEGDVFVALEQGIIDGAEAAQPTIDLELGLHRLARHYYFPGWHQPATLLNLVINLDTWNKLTPSLQNQVRSVCGDNIQLGFAESAGSQFNALKVLTAKGVSVETWSPEIMSALRQAWSEVVREQLKTSRDFARAWNSLKRFREEYGIWHEIGQPAPR